MQRLYFISHRSRRPEIFCELRADGRLLQLSEQDGLNEWSVHPTLCHPQATSQGAHWDTDHCPYDDDDFRQGRRTVHAPQHTHPHPSFSLDGRQVVFTSDRDGCSQVYEVTVPQA